MFVFVSLGDRSLFNRLPERRLTNWAVKIRVYVEGDFLRRGIPASS